MALWNDPSLDKATWERLDCDATGILDFYAVDSVISEQFRLIECGRREDVEWPCSISPTISLQDDLTTPTSASEGGSNHFFTKLEQAHDLCKGVANSWLNGLDVQGDPQSPRQCPTSIPSPSSSSTTFLSRMTPIRQESSGSEESTCDSNQDLNISMYDHHSSSGPRRTTRPGGNQPQSARRKEQNRAAQRRYRWARDQRIRSAEGRVRELETEIGWLRGRVLAQEEHIALLEVQGIMSGIQ